MNTEQTSKNIFMYIFILQLDHIITKNTNNSFFFLTKSPLPLRYCKQDPQRYQQNEDKRQQQQNFFIQQFLL